MSDRDIDFATLRPEEPEFQLAGDSERVALTCADLGVRAHDLDLPVPLDRVAYQRAVAMLERRGIIDPDSGRLSAYGRAVEALPVDRPWAELIVNASETVLPYIAVMSAIESLHRMTREDRDLSGLIVGGSDHLTAYNVYAEAFTECGAGGEVYGLPRHLFDERVTEWADRRGVLVKALEDAALAVASVYRSVGLPLPTAMPRASDEIRRAFADLVAEYMPLDLVIDEETADGEPARVSRSSVCGSWGAVAGKLRYFADRMGVPRAAIEGTQIPMDLIRKYATRHAGELVFDPKRRGIPFATERRVEYYGFELESERDAMDVAPPADVAARLKREYAVRPESARKSRGRGAKGRGGGRPNGSRGPGGKSRGRGGSRPGKRRGR
jgi:uncharacterized membrane protein YgcG